MWNDAVYIDKSNIEGNGLKAKRNIKQGEVVVDYRDLPWYKMSVHDLTEYQINHQ